MQISMIHHLKVAATALILLMFLGFPQPSRAQDVLPPNDFGVESDDPANPLMPGSENLSIAIRWIGNEYISPETQGVDRNYLSFESFDEVAGEDVRIELWGQQPGAPMDVWVFVHDRTAEKWWTYGHTTREGNGIWVAHGVRFGEGAHQGQRFTVRAAVMDQPPSGPLVSAEEWQSAAVAISDPVYLTVKKRLIRPYPQDYAVERPRLWLSTIDHQTVAATEAVVVAPSAGITGTFELPQIDQKNSDQDQYIYALIRSTATNRWRVFGPAVVNGVKWEIRDVDITDPGEPQWVRFKISAVMTSQKLPAEEVEYDQWWEHKIAASDPVEVAVKSALPTLERPFPFVQISQLQTLDDTLSVNSLDPLQVDSLAGVIQVGGKVANLPQGASIWLLINPLGTPVWEVYGKAISSAIRWRLPLVIDSRLKALRSDTYRVMAVVSASGLSPGYSDYQRWRSRALAVSAPVVIHEATPNTALNSSLMLQIDEIAGAGINDGRSRANVFANSNISGTVDHLPAGQAIWTAIRTSRSNTWHISGPAVLSEGRWQVPNAFFPDKNEGGDLAVTENYYDVMAIATRGELPVKALQPEKISWYANSNSAVVRVVPVSGAAQWFYFSGYGLQMNALLIIMLVMLVMTALEYYFRATSSILATMGEQLEQLGLYLKGEFRDMPRPEVIPATLGTLILILGVFAIVSYFPIYTHTLEQVLKLSHDKSESLALLLIIFIGLAGVIIHLSIEYVSHREGPMINKIFDAFLNYALPVTVILVTFALWGVQALLYLELYIDQVEPGNIRIPAAMGAAAFFIAGIETLGFYWATRLGRDFFGWVLFHALLIGPPILLGKAMQILTTLFLKLPHRGDLSEEERNETPVAGPDNLAAAQPGRD